MIPKLFQIGPVSVYSYGLMMGVAFLVGNILLTSELRRKRLDVRLATSLTFIALVGGIAGSKLAYLLENTDEFRRGILRAIFSPAGLTFYGGLIVVAIVLIVFVRIKRLSFLRIADTIAPALILAYGIGRIGCQLAGDGDYGIPTTLPWGMTYAHGTAKPTIELRDYFVHHPEMDSVYHYSVLSTQVVGHDDFGFVTRFDQTVPLHPTPLYETLYSLAIFGILWWRRRALDTSTGRLFGLYCILAGGSRFLIEFLRLNPLYFGFSLSQWIGAGVVVVGAVLWVTRKARRPTVLLELLTGEECHLCEEMRQVLEPLRGSMGFEIEETVIHEGDAYWDEYHEKIPVLLLDGRMIAKYRITAEALEQALKAPRGTA